MFGVGPPLVRKEAVVEKYLRTILLQQIITRRLAIKIVSASVEQASEIFQKFKVDSTVHESVKQESVRIILRATFGEHQDEACGL